MVTILIGKSGSGKDYNKRLLIEKGYEPIVTYTTRPMRVGEINGKDYWYISKDKFMDMIDNNEFVEYRKYNTLYNGVEDVWWYGVGKIIMKILVKY